MSVVRSLLLSALVVSALVSRTDGCRFSKDGFNLLRNIQNHQPRWDSETMMYTPTQQHYQRCPGFTRSCLRKEMEMLLNELNITNKRTTKILNIINPNTQVQDQTQESACGDCENLPVKQADVFLDFVNSTLQWINSECSSAS